MLCAISASSAVFSNHQSSIKGQDAIENSSFRIKSLTEVYMDLFYSPPFSPAFSVSQKIKELDCWKDAFLENWVHGHQNMSASLNISFCSLQYFIHFTGILFADVLFLILSDFLGFTKKYCVKICLVLKSCVLAFFCWFLWFWKNIGEIWTTLWFLKFSFILLKCVPCVSYPIVNFVLFKMPPL